MSLCGEGVVAIWNDIQPEGRDDFFEWHNREHMPERVGIPGFRRGRRYIAIEASPEFFTLYETDSPQVLVGADYLGRLNSPTGWTRRATSHFFNTSRSLCSVAWTAGTGSGGYMITWRYNVAERREAEQRAKLAHEILPLLVDRAGVVGAHLCIADRAGSAIETEEKKGRAEKAKIPGWIILVEGAGNLAQFDAACREALNEAVLTGAGALGPIERGIYQLHYTRLKTAAAVG
jgi:hypothetical protein